MKHRSDCYSDETDYGLHDKLINETGQNHDVSSIFSLVSCM